MGSEMCIRDRPRFNRITGVSTDGTEINVAGITSVSGVCNGGVLNGLIPGSLDVPIESLLARIHYLARHSALERLN